MLKIKYSRS